jgi:hypothetical protein
MPNRLALVGAVFAAIAALLGPQRASADGNLVLYCAGQEEWCRNMVAAFERQTGIKVAMTRKGAVETALDDWCLPEMDLWAVFPAGRLASAKARAFVAFVEAGLRC